MNSNPKSIDSPTLQVPPLAITDNIVELRSVTLRFDAQSILNSINIAIPAGQTVVIIGESGCGKTVLLKLIVGLLKPSQGEVFFEGAPISQLPEAKLIQLRLRVGFLFQGAALFDSLTVFDNIAFGLRSLGWKSDAIQTRVEERIREVGLATNVLNKLPSELSGGMKKRVGLARALALDPEVMLYDEPTTGLDPIMSDVINELIRQIRQKRPITSVVVTHDMKTTMKVADRVIMLYPLNQLSPSEPQILFDGTPEEIHRCPDLRVKQFIEGSAGDRLTRLE